MTRLVRVADLRDRLPTWGGTRSFTILNDETLQY